MAKFSLACPCDRSSVYFPPSLRSAMPITGRETQSSRRSAAHSSTKSTQMRFASASAHSTHPPSTRRPVGTTGVAGTAAIGGAPTETEGLAPPFATTRSRGVARICDRGFPARIAHAHIFRTCAQAGRREFVVSECKGVVFFICE